MAVVAPLLLVAQGLASCGDDGGGSACVAGEIRDCMCTGSQTGEQSCRDDGGGFNDCSCDGGSSGDGGSGGSAGGGNMAGSSGATGEPMPIFDIGLIGAPCESDDDCSDAVPNFTCIASTSDAEFGVGGPEGGYCTVPCRESEDCNALDGASACGFIDETTGEGYCIALCLTGDNPNAKCGGGEFRAQACFQSPTAGLGACIPMCTSDEGCGEGRFCAQEPMTAGLCVDTAPEGGGVGAACTPDTQEADCASDICLTFTDPDTGMVAGGFCSANCTYGAPFGCGYAPGTPVTTPRENFCLQEQEPGGAPGDLGFCFELCDGDGDCAQDDWVCDEFGSANLQMLLGRQGQCVPSILTNDGAGDAGPG